MTSAGFLEACSWCQEWGIDEKASVLGQPFITKAVVSHEKDENDKDFEKEEQEVLDSSYPLINDSFYKEYLEKFYPKALVVADYFYEMCPFAIDAALQEVVNILSHDEWFYYQNKPEGFSSGEYWEVTLYQCVLINKFLSRSWFDFVDNKIYSEDDLYEWDEDEDHDVIGLSDFFKQNGMKVHFYFYAEYSDRLVKMFNEGIKTFDLLKARRYSILFSRIIAKLRGFCDCHVYEEEVRTQKELIAILRHKVK